MVWGGQYFDNDLTRKYITVFGKTFSNLTIVRETSNTTLGANSTANVETMTMKVPLTYGAKEAMLARLEQDPNLDRPEAQLLPRMSFDITGTMVYDTNRKIPSIGRHVWENANNSIFSTMYNPVPYNIPFRLVIYTKYQQDAFKIFEQIISFFPPEFTPSIELIDGIPPFDCAIVVGDPTIEDTYSQDFKQRRVFMITIPFIMKAYYFGPEIDRPMIKFIRVNVYAGKTYEPIGWGVELSQFANSTQTTLNLYSNGYQAELPQSTSGNSQFTYVGKVDQELVLVTGGFGSNTLTVERAWANTLANCHFQGATFYPTNEGNFAEYITTQPGLTSNGQPTDSVNNSVAWETISVEDDYGYASEIYTVNDLGV